MGKRFTPSHLLNRAAKIGTRRLRKNLKKKKPKNDLNNSQEIKMNTKKPFPWTAIAIGLTVFGLVSASITNNAIQGEKVKQLESKTTSMCKEQKEVDAANIADHRAILNSLTRIETKLEYLPSSQRYSGMQHRRDTIK
jgi:hypothetical protein